MGFTRLPLRSELQNIMIEGLKAPDYRAYTVDDDNDDVLLGQFDIQFDQTKKAEYLKEGEPQEAGTDLPERPDQEIAPASGGAAYQIGLSVCGQFDDKDEFYADYYYPYLDSGVVSSTEEITVEPRVDNDSYAGVCDDLRIGAALIFRLRNSVEYRKSIHTSFLPLASASVSLTALSLEGSVMLPIYKSPDDISRKKNTEIKRRRLLNAARSGDENAMRDLTESEMETWSNILSRIQVDDVYTLVESYFMPYGAECELYSVLGIITHCESLRNRISGEEVCILQIESNGLPLAIAINREDLVGDPQPGRRFKGIIWLQGKINFPLGCDCSRPERKEEKNG